MRTQKINWNNWNALRVVSPPCPLLLSKADFGKLFTNFFSFMYFEFLLAPLYHFLDLNNACLLFLRIAELLIIE